MRATRLNPRATILDFGNYQAETLALFNRMTVLPDTNHRAAINTLILALKSGGVWTKLDGLHLLAAHTEQAALLNWVTNARDLVSFNSPTFTTDRGITGGGTSYLATNSFLGSGLQMASGDEGLGVWVRTNVVEASAISACLATNNTGSSTVRYTNPRNASTQIVWRMNFTTTQTSPNHATGDNMLASLGRNSGDTDLYYNGALDDTFTQAVVDDPRTLTLYLVVGRTGSTYSARQHSAVFYGKYLDASKQAILYNALFDYMTALGAV